VEDLADKIMTILKNEELREKMGEAGRKRAKEFTWDKIAERTVEMYKEILSKHE
jgi:glycosyltransferase involved in cell wall biosynthesis